MEVRDLRGRKMEDGQLLGKKTDKSPKLKKIVRNREITAPVSFRQRPWTSAGVRDVFGRQTEDG